MFMPLRQADSFLVFEKSKTYVLRRGNAVAQLIEALRYKPESRGFESPYGLHEADQMEDVSEEQP